MHLKAGHRYDIRDMVPDHAGTAAPFTLADVFADDRSDPMRMDALMSDSAAQRSGGQRGNRDVRVPPDRQQHRHRHRHRHTYTPRTGTPTAQHGDRDTHIPRTTTSHNPHTRAASPPIPNSPPPHPHDATPSDVVSSALATSLSAAAKVVKTETSQPSSVARSLRFRSSGTRRRVGARGDWPFRADDNSPSASSMFDVPFPLHEGFAYNLASRLRNDWPTPAPPRTHRRPDELPPVRK